MQTPDALVHLSPWFRQPLPRGETVRQVMEALLQHPVARISNQDQISWAREEDGRWRIFIENQGNFSITVGPESLDAWDAPVLLDAYWTSILELPCNPGERYPLGSFRRLLWHMIGHCILMSHELNDPWHTGTPCLAEGVTLVPGLIADTRDLVTYSDEHMFGPHRVWFGEGEMLMQEWGRAVLRRAD